MKKNYFFVICLLSFIISCSATTPKPVSTTPPINNENLLPGEVIPNNVQEITNNVKNFITNLHGIVDTTSDENSTIAYKNYSTEITGTYKEGAIIEIESTNFPISGSYSIKHNYISDKLIYFSMNGNIKIGDKEYIANNFECIFPWGNNPSGFEVKNGTLKEGNTIISNDLASCKEIIFLLYEICAPTEYVEGSLYSKLDYTFSLQADAIRLITENLSYNISLYAKTREFVGIHDQSDGCNFVVIYNGNANENGKSTEFKIKCTEEMTFGPPTKGYPKMNYCSLNGTFYNVEDIKISHLIE